MARFSFELSRKALDQLEQGPSRQLASLLQMESDRFLTWSRKLPYQLKENVGFFQHHIRQATRWARHECLPADFDLETVKTSLRQGHDAKAAPPIHMDQFRVVQPMRR